MFITEIFENGQTYHLALPGEGIPYVCYIIPVFVTQTLANGRTYQVVLLGFTAQRLKVCRTLILGPTACSKMLTEKKMLQKKKNP